MVTISLCKYSVVLPVAVIVGSSLSILISLTVMASVICPCWFLRYIVTPSALLSMVSFSAYSPGKVLETVYPSGGVMVTSLVYQPSVPSVPERVYGSDGAGRYLIAKFAVSLAAA